MNVFQKISVLSVMVVGATVMAMDPQESLENLRNGAGMLPLVQYDGAHYLMMSVRSEGSKLGAGTLSTIGSKRRGSRSLVDEAVGAFVAKTKCVFSCNKKHGENPVCSVRCKYACACAEVQKNVIAPDVPLAQTETYALFAAHLKLSKNALHSLNRWPHPSVAKYVLISLAEMEIALKDNRFTALYGFDGTHEEVYPLWEQTQLLFQTHADYLKKYIELIRH